MRAFAAAARRDTLHQAAEDLHVTHGAVSRQIHQLEQALGEPLFSPRGRGRVLTPRGRRLADALHAIFDDLSHTLEDFRRDGPAQPLSVSCEPTLCLKMLIRALAPLKADTGLDIKLLAAGGPVDFARDGIDLAIRRTDFPIDPALDLYPLADEMAGPVLSPALLRDHEGAIGHLPRLHSQTRPEAWRTWCRNSGLRPTRARRHVFEHFYQTLEAAQAGQGVAIASVYMAAADLGAGLLAAPHGFAPDGTRYVCLSPLPIAQDPRRRIFAAWLARHMRDLARPVPLR
nr:LysR family transcriptional regulator [Gluconacetobacter sacchari]